MKKFLSILVLVLVAVFCITACTTQVCENHIDADKNGLCDNCQGKVEVDTCPDHADTDGDNICDNCGKSVTSGGENSDKEFTVTFDLNTTAVSAAKVQPQKVLLGGTLTEPTVIVRGDNPDNWSVRGWYTDPECTVEWDFDIDTVDKDMTLYARWTSTQTHTVTYFAGIKDYSLSEIHQIKITSGLTAERCDDRIVGRQVLGYYSDAAFTVPYDFDKKINEDTRIYIEISEYLYFGADILSKFEPKADASILLNDDGTFDFMGPDGAYIFQKDLGLDMGTHNGIEIKVKIPDSRSQVSAYIFGEYTINGIPGATTDYGQDYTKCSTYRKYYQDGEWTIIRINFGEFAEGFKLTKLNGLRLDIYGTKGASYTQTVEYVKSFSDGSYVPDVKDGWNVTYKGDLEGIEVVAKNGTIKGLGALGKIPSYFTDPACVVPFDTSTPITEDTTLYVKLSKSIYFTPKSLATFNQNEGAVTYLNDGMLTFSGRHGSFIHKKDLALNMGDHNAIDIKVKIAPGSKISAFVYGEYRIGAQKGESTDYGQEYTNCSSIITVKDAGDGWSIVRIDFSKFEDGFKMEVLNGLRIDMFSLTGSGNFTQTVAYVLTNYSGETGEPPLNTGILVIYNGDKIAKEYVEEGGTIKGIEIPGREIQYFTDPACLVPFDPATPITESVRLYVKASDYIYFSPNTLYGFTLAAGARTLIDDNGRLSFSGPNGAYIHKKGLGIDMGAHNGLVIKAKVASGSRISAFIFGKYTINGVAGESTDYGNAYTNCSSIITTESDGSGWTIITIDFGKLADGFKLETLNGLRLDIYGDAGRNYYQTVEYVKSVEGSVPDTPDVPDIPDDSEKYTVTYLGDKTGKETVAENTSIAGVSVFGKQVLYFTDAACLVPYDAKEPVTGDLTLYTKISDYIYFDGTSLGKFTPKDGASVNVNPDGTINISGINGAFIHHKGLGLEMGEHNAIEIRVKIPNGESTVSAYIFGKYTINGVAGESTDYGNAYTNCSTIRVIENDGEWSIIRIDFSKLADGFKLDVLNGLRIDIFGKSDTYTQTVEYVKSYKVELPPVPDVTYKVTYEGEVTGEETVGENSVIKGLTVLGKEVIYYTDAACLSPYSVSSTVTADMTLYTKVSDYAYFGAPTMYGSSGTLENGKIVFENVGNTIINKTGFAAVTTGGANTIIVRAKFDKSKITQFAVFCTGTLSDGTALTEAASGVYLPVASSGEPDADGYYTLIFDLSGKTGGKTVDSITQIRFDFYTNGPASLTFDYIKTAKQIVKHTVTYEGELTGTEQVVDGSKIAGVNVFGKEVLYFKDAACLSPFNPQDPITESITLYTKAGSQIYIKGNDLSAMVGGGATGASMQNGRLTLTVSSAAIINNRTLSITTDGTVKVTVRVKFGSAIPSQVAMFFQGKDAAGNTYGESAMGYVSNYGTPDSEGFYTITFDLSTRSNYKGSPIVEFTQLRFDVYDVNGSTVEIDSITSEKYVKPLKNFTVTYAGGVSLTESVVEGEKALGVTVTGKEILGYYTDAAYTTPFDITSAITSHTTVYVKVSDYAYFDGAALKDLVHANSQNVAVTDGKLTFTVGGDVVINNKALNTTFAGATQFVARIKFSSTPSQLALFFAGQDAAGNTYGESTFAYQANYGTPDSEGFYTVVFDITPRNNYKGSPIVSLTQLRLDIYGASGAAVEIDYIKSVTYVKPLENFTVTYAGGVSLTESVVEGEKALGVTVTGKEILGYYTDAAYTTPFDITSAITSNTTVYVKVSDYAYFDGAALKDLVHANSQNVAVTDGKLTFTVGGDVVINNKALNTTFAGATQFVARIKFSSTPSQLALFFAGQDAAGNTYGESTFAYQSNYGTPDSEGFYTVVFDITPRNNYKGSPIVSLTQLRLDIYGASGAAVEIDYIKSVTAAKPLQNFTVTYAGDRQLSETVTEGDAPLGITENYVKHEYYTDKLYTNPYDITKPITADTVIYVKSSVYLDGEDLLSALRAEVTATSKSVVDGKLVINGMTATHSAGIVVHAKNLNVNTNLDTVKFTVKAKFDPSKFGTQFAMFLSGTKTDGTTDSSFHETIQCYLPLTNIGTPDEDGFYTLVFNFAGDSSTKLNASQMLKQLTIIRLDMALSDTSGADLVIESITSEAIAKEPETFTVTYTGDKTGSEEVTEGNKAVGLTADTNTRLAYYSDSAMTVAFDMNAEITKNETVYVKKTVYLGGEYLLGALRAEVTATSKSVVDGKLVINGMTATHSLGIVIHAKNINMDTRLDTTKLVVRAKFDPSKFGTQFAMFLSGTKTDGTTDSSFHETIQCYLPLTNIGTPDEDGFYTLVFNFAGDSSTKLNASQMLKQLTIIRLDMALSDTSGTDIVIESIYTE